MSKYEDLIDEDARRRFESDWMSNSAKSIEAYLPPIDHSSYWPTLEELIYIDLEFMWKQFSNAPQEETVSIDTSPTSRLKAYSLRFSLEKDQELLQRLLDFDQSLREKSTRRDDRGSASSVKQLEFETVPFASDPNDKHRHATTPTTQQSTAKANAKHDLGQEKDFGEFTLTKILGRGGMGVVFEAIEKKTGRNVALKMIRSNFIDSVDHESMQVILDRFQTEARAVAKLDHPNIVSLYQVGEHKQTPFLSMKLVNGSDLASHMRKNVLHGKTAARYIGSIADAVYAAHEKGIIHRDLKPHNILLDNDSDQPLVTDFGLAKLTSDQQSVTVTGELMGTPGYMSPEQAKGRVVDELTDVYSLGATLYALIGGRAPFQAADTMKTLEQIVTKPPIALREINPDIDKDLETICMKCLEKKPAERYASARDLQLDLERYVKGEPILARPINVLERSYRWSRRNPLPTTIMIGIALLLLSSIVGWSFTTYYAKQSRDNELIAENRANETQVFATLYQENHDLALMTLREQMYEISENMLLRVPGVKEVRTRLLKTNRQYFMQFIEKNSSDQQLPADLAFAHFAIGKLDRDLVSPDAAVKSLDIAIKMQKEALKSDPKNETIQFDLANSLNLRGECFARLGNLTNAKTDFDSAHSIRQDLAEAYPKDIEHQRKYANVEMNLGNWQAYDGDQKKALVHFRKSNEIRERIIDAKILDKELVFRLKFDRAKCSYNIALSLLDLEQDIDAETNANDGLKRLAALHLERPRAIDVMRDYTRCASLVAELRQLKNESPEPYLKEIAEANEALYKLFPEEKNLLGFAGVAFLSLGDFQLSQANLSESETSLLKAYDSLSKVVEFNPEFETNYVQALLALDIHYFATGNSSRAADSLNVAEKRIDALKKNKSPSFDVLNEQLQKQKLKHKKPSDL